MIYEFFFFLQYLEINYVATFFNMRSSRLNTIRADNLFELTTVALNTAIFNTHTNYLFNLIYNYFIILNSSTIVLFSTNNNLYLSEYFSNSDELMLSKYNHQELSNVYRFNRFSNPIFKYDYKAGDYFPKLYKEIYTHLFTTIGSLTSGLRTT